MLNLDNQYHSFSQHINPLQKYFHPVFVKLNLSISYKIGHEFKNYEELRIFVAEYNQQCDATM